MNKLWKKQRSTKKNQKYSTKMEYSVFQYSCERNEWYVYCVHSTLLYSDKNECSYWKLNLEFFPSNCRCAVAALCQSFYCFSFTDLIIFIDFNLCTHTYLSVWDVDRTIFKQLYAFVVSEEEIYTMRLSI